MMKTKMMTTMKQKKTRMKKTSASAMWCVYVVGAVNEVSGARGCATAACFLRAPERVKAPLPPDDEENEEENDDDDDDDALVARMGAPRRAKMSFLSDNLTRLTDTDALRRAAR